MSTFIDRVAGRYQQIVALLTSAGAGDANKLVQTGADGRLHSSLMPIGFGEDIKQIVASEDLAGGDFIQVWNDGGTTKVRKADASASGKEADGFVLDAFLTGVTATVYFEGTNNGLAGLTIGARYYLSAVSPGDAVATAPTGVGVVSQYLGRAISATEIAFESDEGVILAE